MLTLHFGDIRALELHRGLCRRARSHVVVSRIDDRIPLDKRVLYLPQDIVAAEAFSVERDRPPDLLQRFLGWELGIESVGRALFAFGAATKVGGVPDQIPSVGIHLLEKI